MSVLHLVPVVGAVGKEIIVFLTLIMGIVEEVLKIVETNGIALEFLLCGGCETKECHTQ